jgi:hypothetical protein
MLKNYEGNIENDSVLLITDEEQVMGPVCPLVRGDASLKSAERVRASAILTLRNNYDLQVDYEFVPVKYGIHTGGFTIVDMRFDRFSIKYNFSPATI